jgi:hypothetical protein
VRSFDPVRLGSREAGAWVAYYRHEWWRFLRCAVGMVRTGFGMSWPRTLLGAWFVLRAAGRSHASFRHRRGGMRDPTSPLVDGERVALVRSYATLLAAVYR